MWRTPTWGTIFRCQKSCETIITVTFSKNLTLFQYDTKQGKHYYCKHTYHSFYWWQSSTSITFIVSTFSDSRKTSWFSNGGLISYINNASSTYTVTWYLLQPPTHPKMLLRGNIVDVSHLLFIYFFCYLWQKPKCHHLRSWESGAALESSNVRPCRSCFVLWLKALCVLFSVFVNK